MITHSIEYYSAIKKKSVLCNKWMDFESIMLSETHQIEEDKY